MATTAIGPNATVVLTFSESLNPATVSSSTFGLFANGQWLAGTVALGGQPDGAAGGDAAGGERDDGGGDAGRDGPVGQ